MTQLTAEQVYAVAVGAEFPTNVGVVPGVSVAACMTAIALRESNGCPEAHNDCAATGDDSYGLWQIDMMDVDVRRLIQAQVLMPLLKTKGAMGATYEALLDPATNAKAAFLLWGGSNRNLTIAWYVYEPEPVKPTTLNQVTENAYTAAIATWRKRQALYQARYESHLPAALAAEAAWKAARG